jgi:hypothetical protein
MKKTRDLAIGPSDEAFDLMRDESDRGCALIGGAVLDEALANLLTWRFVDRKVAHTLIDSRGPLSTFAARIDVTFALGLILGDTHRCLHTVKEIRNEAAHFERKKGAGFNTGFTSEHTSRKCLSLLHGRPELAKKYEKRPRDVFSMFVGGTLSFLEATAVAFKMHEEQGPPDDPSYGFPAHEYAARNARKMHGVFLDGVAAYPDWPAEWGSRRKPKIPKKSPTP